jgi:hypothetical protein
LIYKTANQITQKKKPKCWHLKAKLAYLPIKRSTKPDIGRVVAAALVKAKTIEITFGDRHN